MKRVITIALLLLNALIFASCSIAPLEPVDAGSATQSTKAPTQNSSYASSSKSTPKVTVSPEATCDFGTNYMGFLPNIATQPTKTERTTYGVSVRYDVISVDEFDAFVESFTKNGFTIDAAFSGMKYSGMRTDGIFASVQVNATETLVEIYSTLIPSPSPAE